MAEIGLAASIIAVIQISKTVITEAYKYGQSVKSARSDIERIEIELKDVDDRLAKLQDLVAKAERSGRSLDCWPELVSMNQKDGALSKCKSALNSLLVELTPADGRLARMKERALWPSKMARIEKALEGIVRQKNSFVETLNIEQIGQVQEIGCTVENISKVQDDETLNTILEWLSQTDHATNHIAALDRREPQTGSWFIQGKEYSDWKELPRSFLWLHGIPGCGKTILCSTIVEDIRARCASKPNSSVAYFYFSFNNTENQRTRNFLRSVLRQLSCSKPRIPECLQSLYNSYKHEQPPTEGLKSAIRSVLELADQNFIIVDALDECPYGEERAQLSTALGEFSKWALPNLHVLVTSRKEPDIDKALAPLMTSSPICIQTKQIDADISLYVKSQLENDVILKERAKNPRLKEEIETTLVNGANGMFRWAFCQLESLKVCLNAREIREALKSLPKTLDDTYSRILSGIDERYHQKAIAALQWLAFSERPLRIEELAEAVVINPRADPPFDAEDRLDDPHYMLQILSSLVVLSTRQERRILGGFLEAEGKAVEEIKLAHFSVKEYLVSDRAKPPPVLMFCTTSVIAHRAIAESCLLYMLHYDQAEDKSLSIGDLAKFPLLRYASQFWPAHVKSNQDAMENPLSKLVLKLFASGTGLSSWLQVYQPEKLSGSAFKNPHYDFAPPLYYASYLGLYHTVNALVDSGAEVNAQGGQYGNALQAASAKGHDQIVQLLLEKGADVNAQGGEYGNALQAASLTSHFQIILRLLEKGAGVNAQGGCYGNALQAASLGGYDQIVQLLLEKGADVNAQGGIYGNALQIASSRGRDQIVQQLLEKDADVNAQGGCYGNALQAASLGGHGQIVQQLLEKGADVNAQGGPCGNALQAASVEGHDQIVWLLLEKGANVHAQSGIYSNALQAASRQGHYQIVQHLLEMGADANAQGGYYGNALQAASLQGFNQIVQLLLKNGADVNAQGGYYCNTLQAASFEGHIEIVQLLLEKGADINAQGGEYGNALQAASRQGHDQIAQLLLKNGADVNAHGGCYDSALQAASFGGHVQIVEQLLRKGAEVNTQGGHYDNALQAASREGNYQIVQLLLEKGADINEQGKKYGHVLHAASYRGHHRTVQLLLENGADVNAHGGPYDNALIAASLGGRDQIVQLLLDNGADINAHGEYYDSALQAASLEGHSQIVQLLLDNGAVMPPQGELPTASPSWDIFYPS